MFKCESNLKTRIKSRRTQMFSLLSFSALLISLSIWILWTYAYDLGATQSARVHIFKEYLPGFLQGKWDATLFSLSCGVLAVILSRMALKSSGKFWKTFNTLVLFSSCFLVALNLFSMM